MDSKEGILTSEAIESASVPAAYDNYGGEILVANGDPPGWLILLPYLTVLAALAYYFHVRPLDPVNTVIAVLFLIWLVYTPIARRLGWFYIPL